MSKEDKQRERDANFIMHLSQKRFDLVLADLGERTGANDTKHKGANIDVLMISPSGEQATALYIYATTHPDPAVIDFLIKHGADVNFKDSQGMTILDKVNEKINSPAGASRKGDYEEVAAKLVAANAQLSGIKSSPEMQAAPCDPPEIKLSVPDKSGNQFLHVESKDHRFFVDQYIKGEKTGDVVIGEYDEKHKLKQGAIVTTLNIVKPITPSDNTFFAEFVPDKALVTRIRIAAQAAVECGQFSDVKHEINVVHGVPENNSGKDTPGRQ